jgi:hypothetical protein
MTIRHESIWETPGDWPNPFQRIELELRRIERESCRFTKRRYP